MSNALDLRVTHYNTITNDLFLDEQESLIEKDSLSYYEKRKYTFYERPDKEKICDKQISKDDYLLHCKIKKICDKHVTNFKVVIVPLYDQKRFNLDDRIQLTEIFGDENVFDYSSINCITENKFITWKIHITVTG